MERNNGWGLGLMSEEGLESLHKLVRRYRLTAARKTCLDAAIEDIFTRLLIRSDSRVYPVLDMSIIIHPGIAMVW